MGMSESVFEQQDFEQGVSAALSRLTEFLPTHVEEWFSNPIVSFVHELCQKQSEECLEPVFCISASMLRTALLYGEPGYRLDAYGADWMLYERPIATTFVPCPWLLPLWTELTGHFQTILDQREIQKYCSPLQAEQAAWSCTGPLFSMIGSLVKYLLHSVEESTELRKLTKGNEFKIEFGEFLDWKLTWVAEYPEIDLFNIQGRKFPHRKFCGKVFDQKRFYKFNLKGSIFQDCIFTNSTILSSTLNDCLFTNCRFKNVTFSDVLLVGAQFQGCTLEHVTFDNVIASLVGLPPEKVDDWYRAFAMAYTSLDHVHFSDCDLRGGQMEQCTTTYATIENTLVDVSDFSVLEINKQG